MVLYSVFKGVLVLYSVFKGVLVLYSVFKGGLALFSVFKSVLEISSVFIEEYLRADVNTNRIRLVLATGDRAAHVSGQVLIACGENVTVVGRPDITQPESQFHNEGMWSVEKLDQQLSPYFADRRFGDGYAVPGA